MITMDSREPTRLKKKLEKKKIKVKLDYLDIGDFLLPGNVCIERKTAQDFMGSIRDKRIWTQAKNLEQYDHAIIAIIGSEKEKWKSFYFTKSHWAHKQWNGAIGTLATKFNVSVMTFNDENDFLDFLKVIDKKLSGKKQSTRPSPLVRKAKNDKERRENCLCSVPGISIKKAQKLLEHFETIENIAKAGPNELQHCQGVGKKLAKNIHKLFH